MRTIVLLGFLAIPSAAFAQGTDEPPTTAPTTATVAKTGENVTLPAKRVFLHANFELELSKGAAGDKISLSPDVFFGVNEKLTIGVVHSSVATTGLMGPAGSSLCVGDGCKIYNGIGLDARYQLVNGKVSIAGVGGLHALNFDPDFQLRLKLGVVGRFRPSPDSKLAIDFTPSIFFGFTERKPPQPMMGVVVEQNTELVVLPGTVLFAVTKQVSIALQTGIGFGFDDPAEQFFVPVAIGASFWVNNQISIDAAFALLAVVGGDRNPQTGVDGRTFTVGGGYAF